jgi:hypothetical protein
LAGNEPVEEARCRLGESAVAVAMNEDILVVAVLQ